MFSQEPTKTKMHPCLYFFSYATSYDGRKLPQDTYFVMFNLICVDSNAFQEAVFLFATYFAAGGLVTITTGLSEYITSTKENTS